MATDVRGSLPREWLGPESELSRFVEDFSRKTVESYRKQPALVLQDANMERAIVDGHYGDRQIYELVQNAADQLIGTEGQIEVILTSDALYCANAGDPFTVSGAMAILMSYSSNKKGVEIGRFGLGFKSVLAVTKRPEIFSRSGSFGFDHERAAASIRRVLPDEQETPTLRIGFPLDPRREASEDPVLASVAQWATTVVRLPLDHDATGISDQFSSFPAEFLIFCEHVRTLVFDDRTKDERTVYTVTRDGSSVTVENGGQSQSWNVFTRTLRPSAAACEDGGYSAKRDEIPVQWAVSTPRLGRLWAFFPTKEVVTASGIFNAPWKLTDDRSAIIEGQFNSEILDEAADLFLSNLGGVCDAKDPGQILELFPGREREHRGSADLALIKGIYGSSPAHEVIPDQDGELQLASSLIMHPPGIPPTALISWHKSPTRPSNWCHPSVESKGDSTIRRAKAMRLLETGSGRVGTFSEWLLALLDVDDPVESSRRMIFVAGCVEAAQGDKAEGYRAELRNIQFVLASDGTMVAPDPSSIFLPSSDGSWADVRTVHPELATNVYVVEELKRLGVREVSDEALLDAQVLGARGDLSGADWAGIWERSRRCPGLLPALLNKHGIPFEDVRVRTLASSWARAGSVLRLGHVLRRDELTEHDMFVAVDEDWHGRDLQILQTLGIAAGPVDRQGSTDEPWGGEYLQEGRETYRLRCKGVKVGDEQILFEGLGTFAGPATPLRQLSAIPAARFLAAALEHTKSLGPIELRHRTNKKLPIVSFPHPLAWLAKRSGCVLSSLGVVPLTLAVSPALREFRDVLAVAEVPQKIADQLGLPTSLEALTEAHWGLAHKAIDKLDNPDRIRDVYAAIVEFSPPPEQLRAMVRGATATHDRTSVAVAVTSQEARLLRESGGPYLTVSSPDLRDRLIERWGLRSAADLVGTEVRAVPDGAAETVGDLFPALTGTASEEQLLVRVQPSTELWQDWFTETGRISDSLEMQLVDGVLYVLNPKDDVDLLVAINETLDLGLDESEIDAVIENAAAQATAELKTTLRSARDDAERLLILAGPEALRQRLSPELVDAYTDLHGAPDDRALAELTLADLGLEALSKLAPIMLERGLQVPTSWAGSRRSIQFVRELGFDRGYAGFKSEDRSEILDINGPSSLPELHDYQKVAKVAIQKLIAGEGGLRGLLSLPTGAGKTRVTVQAIVEAMTPEVGLASPVLWIAQTDELCEQAVQSWAEVWRAVGPARPLRVSRLWGNNRAAAVDEGDQVVIATIAKLSRIVGKSEYDWLAEASCIVIDEAHSSTGSSYTSVLRWLGLGGGQERVPLIGLSATPFKGVSDEENRRLTARYGGFRLDFDAFGRREVTTEMLQEMGILSNVVHRVLEGANVDLTDADISYIEEFHGQLPPNVLAKLGEDVGRNRRLLDEILANPADWPTLVFAASVRHAQTMAALLTTEGRTAASISSDTNPAVRRYIVSRFKRGEIQVLTNYGVLTQGFDAPKVRALYIARPTYSPNLYQQMVGRGLRGELNGGNDECLVVNVADNLARYGAELAFREFDLFWRR